MLPDMHVIIIGGFVDGRIEEDLIREVRVDAEPVTRIPSTTTLTFPPDIDPRAGAITTRRLHATHLGRLETVGSIRRHIAGIRYIMRVRSVSFRLAMQPRIR